jgi:hypothetical protein
MTTPAATMLPAIIAKSNMSLLSFRKPRLRPIALRLHSMDTMFGHEPST